MRAQHTILVVDDHPPSLYAASRLLRDAGFRTLEAGSGEEALSLSNAASAVLIDVNLPDMNGVAVCELIKARAAQTSVRTPVVLMSAVYLDELHRDAALQAGADLFVVPPLDGPRIASAFDELLAEPSV